MRGATREAGRIDRAAGYGPRLLCAVSFRKGSWMRRFAILISACVAVSAGGLAGFSFAAGLGREATRVTNVTVHAHEYYWTISQDTVPVGTVVFTIVNDGQLQRYVRGSGTILIRLRDR